MSTFYNFRVIILCPQKKYPVKILKIRTPENFAVITQKFEQGGYTVETEWQTV